jgi:hypothetical protein
MPTSVPLLHKTRTTTRLPGAKINRLSSNSLYQKRSLTYFRFHSSPAERTESHVSSRRCKVSIPNASQITVQVGNGVSASETNYETRDRNSQTRSEKEFQSASGGGLDCSKSFNHQRFNVQPLHLILLLKASVTPSVRKGRRNFV